MYSEGGGTVYLTIKGAVPALLYMDWSLIFYKVLSWFWRRLLWMTSFQSSPAFLKWFWKAWDQLTESLNKHVPCLVGAVIFHFWPKMQFITDSTIYKRPLAFRSEISRKLGEKTTPHKKFIIGFTYYPKVGAFIFVQQYMLTVGLLSWQQANHFFLCSPIQSFISIVSVYW